MKPTTKSTSTSGSEMKGRFEVGDRVHVYGAGYSSHSIQRGFCEAEESPWKAVIKSIDHNILVVRRLSDYEVLSVYPQQCRRLKAKKKRVVVWIAKSEIDSRRLLHSEPTEQVLNNYVKFREVKND